MRIGFDWLRTGTGAGCCECGDEPSGSCAKELVSYSIVFNLFVKDVFGEGLYISPLRLHDFH
jgi:hypothetical protein